MHKYKLLIFLLIYSIGDALANNSIYINLSNNVARKEQLKTIANNIANMYNAGYEADELLIGEYEKPQNTLKNNSFVAIKRSYINHAPLNRKVTKRPLDIAVSGGYLKVLTPEGPRYTLDGHMYCNAEGVLVNHAGHPYLSFEDQPLIIPSDANHLEIAINQEGRIYTPAGFFGQIGIFNFENGASLVKEGSGLYRADTGEVRAEKFSVASHSLGLSNVDTVRSTQQLSELQRSREATTEMIRMIYKLQHNSINKLAH